MGKKRGWLPHQHGAWAMLAVPSVVGLVQGFGADARPVPTTGRLMVVAAFWVGYFCFDATTLWLRARPSRRGPFVRPIAVYAAVAAVLGLGAVALLGPRLLPWGIAYAPLSLGALALTAAHRERSVASGALTVAAACLLSATVAAPDPSALTATALGSAALCFLYFFGTVFAVKTMIRERGSVAWWVASVAYHLTALGLVVAGAAAGRLHWAWPLLYAATAARAAILPRLGPFAHPPRFIRPLHLGLVEIVFSAILLVGLLLARPA